MKQEAEKLYNYYRENLSYLVLAFGRNWRSWQFLIICTLSLILTSGGVLVVFCTLVSIVIYTITKMRRNMESSKWWLHDEIVIHLEDILEYDYRLIALK